MKKLVILLAIMLMTAAVFTGCGSEKNSAGGDAESVDSIGGDAESVDSLKTIGDIIALEDAEKQSAVYNGKVIYAFKLDDTYYRATADITQEQEQEYIDIDITEEGSEDKQNEMLAPIVIDKIENLSEQILTQEEMDALVGKTGEELQAEGWTYSGHNLENMEFWMNYGPFEYTVVFDGEVAERDYETFEAESGTRDMKVKSVAFNTLGDATNIE